MFYFVGNEHNRKRRKLGCSLSDSQAAQVSEPTSSYPFVCGTLIRVVRSRSINRGGRRRNRMKQTLLFCDLFSSSFYKPSCPTLLATKCQTSFVVPPSLKSRDLCGVRFQHIFRKAAGVCDDPRIAHCHTTPIITTTVDGHSVDDRKLATTARHCSTRVGHDTPSCISDAKRQHSGTGTIATRSYAAR